MLDIKELDIDLYCHLLRVGERSINELSDDFDIDRSNINRRLLKLRELDLVSRRPQVMEQGGHRYVYFATRPTEVQKKLQEAFDRWISDSRRRLSEFPANRSEVETTDRPEADSR